MRHKHIIFYDVNQAHAAPATRQSHAQTESYLLRTGRDHPALRNALPARRLQHQSQEPEHRVIAARTSHFRQYDVMSHRIEIGSQVEVDDIGLALDDCVCHAPDWATRSRMDGIESWRTLPPSFGIPTFRGRGVDSSAALAP